MLGAHLEVSDKSFSSENSRHHLQLEFLYLAAIPWSFCRDVRNGSLWLAGATFAEGLRTVFGKSVMTLLRKFYVSHNSPVLNGNPVWVL